MNLSRRSLPALALAVLLPALIVLLAWSGLRAAPDVHGAAAEIEARLAAARRPEVVVLGSSLANRGVDLDVLARELGVKRDAVVLLQLPHAEAAHWYAILKNRVFAKGYRPKLVLLAGALTTMLNHDVLAEQANVDRLVEQMTEDEPVLARKVLGFDDPRGFAARFLRERASGWRDALVGAFRDQVVTWLFTRRHRIEEGERIAEKVNETVFANDRMDYALHAEAPTGFEATEAVKATSAEGYDLRAEALLGDVQDLATAYGARVVWVRMPFPPSNPDMDVVPPGIEAEALRWLEELGAGYLDMRTLDLVDADFEDMRHLTRRGAEKFTTALGRALVGLGALDPEGGVGVVRGLGDVEPPTREGALPPLPSPAGAGCRREAAAGPLAPFDDATRARLSPDVRPPFEVRADGVALPPGDVAVDCAGAWSIADGRLVVAAPRADARVEVVWAAPTWTPAQGGAMAWVLPGTTLRWAVPEAWRLPQRAFRVVARGLRVGAGGGTATLTVQGVDHAFQAVADRMLAAWRPTPPAGPWTLGVSVPPDGAPLLLHHLAVGQPPAATALLGLSETLYGASLRIVGGRLEDTRGTARYAAPPSLEAFRPRVQPGPRNLAQIVVPALAELADAPDQDAGRPSECSPVRVLEDGRPLPLPHATCFDALTKGAGRYCHAGNGFWITAPDDSDPAANGRAYTLALDEDRACAAWVQRQATTLRGSWWLYPGDDATFELPADRLGVFRDGANTLALEVVPRVHDADVPLRVRLVADGRTVVDTTWQPPSGAARQRALRVPIDPPLPARVGRLELRLSNPSAETFYLVTMASVAEDYGAALDLPVQAGPTATADAVRPPARAGRDGTARALPALVAHGTYGDGAVDLRLTPLWPISQTALARVGLGPWSPLRATADGEELTPIADRKAFRDGCARCFVHTGGAVLVRAPAGTSAEVAVRLDDAFPLRTADGDEAWWVYPGTAGWFEVAGLHGDDVEIGVRVVGLHPQREKAGRDLSLRVGTAVATFESVDGGAVAAASLHVRPVDGAVRVAVGNGSERGYALIADVVVHDGVEAFRVLPAQGPLEPRTEDVVPDDEETP